MSSLPDRLRAASDGPIDVAWRAPGRANLIGEHTDYNDGFVLPVALELSTYVAGSHADRFVSLRSLDEPGEAVVDVVTGEGPTEGWGRYVTAVVRALLDESLELRGLTGVVASEVPSGSGLSSSAALEVCLAKALLSQQLEPLRVARICRRAENHYVGVQSGIMDQLASAGGRQGCALLIDCRDESIEPVPLPEHLRVLMIDSGVRRGLGDSAYNDRRAECEQAALALGVGSLRDADIELLERHKNDLSPVAYRRARHVISENERVLRAVEALRAGDLELIGFLFGESHRSLRDDYEVSTPELDALVSIADETPGVVGSRLTGAGFGGCTVQLVEEGGAEAAGAEIVGRYQAETGRTARRWISPAAEGAGPAPTR